MRVENHPYGLSPCGSGRIALQRPLVGAFDAGRMRVPFEDFLWEYERNFLPEQTEFIKDRL